MKEEDKLEKIVRHFVSFKLNELTAEINSEYMKVVEGMNSRTLLNSSITVDNISKKCSLVIIKYIDLIVIEIQKYPMRVKQKYWIIVKDILSDAIDSMDKHFTNKLKTICSIDLINSYTRSNGLFQSSKSKLENIIEESILKANYKGFESESFYKQKSVRLSIIAIIIASLSLLVTILKSFIF